ncbi:hypothetical protein Tco_0218638 [Tanacetum coccineum]
MGRVRRVSEQGNWVLTDSEDEKNLSLKGGKSDDPQDSSIHRTSTPTTTQSRSIDKGRRYKRRKETKSKKVVSSLDFQDHDTAEKINTAGEVNAAGEEVNTASKVNTGSIELNTVIEQDSTAGEDKGQREGKAPMLSEETPKKLGFCRAKLEAYTELSKRHDRKGNFKRDLCKENGGSCDQRKKLFAEERGQS